MDEIGLAQLFQYAIREFADENTILRVDIGSYARGVSGGGGWGETLPKSQKKKKLIVRKK